MSGVDPKQAPNGAEDYAAYVAAMTGEMARIARGHGFRTLAYLLEIVRLEARSIGRTVPPNRGNIAKEPSVAGDHTHPPRPRSSGFSAVARERR
ncbi:hypothetical protein GCM10007301_14470 [Azorhizobium oxalatiphilum]|uniref:Uncharacterized protein n=1 Tax=Azorhizobium oxalatiphilum TaxID=980631 RepID=A0A917BVD7_9HYPH|nr:hypothetical protein [Azorhizobium oxalatiphilum]GGF55924.1 hypothetical protein GCM10007301_14470 [Azorhizobium oxalatiphilum]